MALIKERLFLYPVLCEFNDDYTSGSFDVSFDSILMSEDKPKKIMFVINVSLDDKALQKLLQLSKAKVFLLCYCKNTKFRKIFELNLGKNEIEFSVNDVNKTLELSPLIVSNGLVNDFYSNNFNNDYKGMKFKIETGNILAIGTQTNVFVEKDLNDMTSVRSVITISNGGDNISEIMVEYDEDIIKIIVPSHSFEIYQNYSSACLPIVNSLIIVPALESILSDIIRDGDIDSEVLSKRWFRQMARSVKKNNNADLNFDYIVGKEPLIIAQELVGSPINEAMSEIQKLSWEADE